MSCSIEGKSGVIENKRGDGLVEGHAYALLQVMDVGEERLLCLRNPWGNEHEWNGAWSDDCPKWSQDLEWRLEKKSGADGVFWMCWADFMQIFTDITVCPKAMRKGKEAAEHRMASSKGVVTPHTKAKGMASKAAMSRKSPSPSMSKSMASQSRFNTSKQEPCQQASNGWVEDLNFRVPPFSEVDQRQQETTEEAWRTPPKVLQPPRQPPPVQPMKAWKYAKAGAGIRGVQGCTCPSGHPLQTERVGGKKGHICDGCMTWIPPNSEASACRACDYDLCSECVAAKASAASPSPDTRTVMAAPTAFDPPPRSAPAQPSYPQSKIWSASAAPPSFQPQCSSAMGFRTMDNGWRRPMY